MACRFIQARRITQSEEQPPPPATSSRAFSTASAFLRMGTRCRATTLVLMLLALKLWEIPIQELIYAWDLIVPCSPLGLQEIRLADLSLAQATSSPLIDTYRELSTTIMDAA